ncbi:MAG: RNA polymerase sigma factor, partial [Oscillospiraceae bacterium]|nr:RNA polymerase sigma factor [Oscillospiraceae bacterium]
TRGDQEALAQLYHRTRTAVFGLALSYLKNRHDAEDVTQDTFVRAWENAPSYRPQGKPMAWLLTIARNLSLMKLREKDRTESLPEEDWALPGPDDALTTEDRTVLSAAMSVLEDEEQRIVLLHAVTGLKHREIAESLSLPLSTVLSKYHRALKKLRRKLEGGDPR